MNACQKLNSKAQKNGTNTEYSGINKYRASQNKVDDIYGVYWHDNIRGFSNVLTSVIVDSTEFEFYLK